MPKIGFTVNTVIERSVAYHWPHPSLEDSSTNRELASLMGGASCYIGHIPQTTLEDGRPVPVMIVSLAPQTIDSDCETILYGGIRHSQDNKEHVWLLGVSLDIGLNEDWPPDRLSKAVQESLPNLLKSGVWPIMDKSAQPVWMASESVEKWVCEAIANLKSSEK